MTSAFVGGAHHDEAIRHLITETDLKHHRKKRKITSTSESENISVGKNDLHLLQRMTRSLLQRSKIVAFTAQSG